MQRTNFGELACSIARTLDVIGEPWSPLILRDVFVGFTRFEQIQADLGISRKVLTERLHHLVEHGVLQRHPYDRRPRHEYVLTDTGTELVDICRSGLLPPVPHDGGACAERAGGSGRGVGVLHGGRERLGALLRRRRVHPHDLPAVAVEVEEAA